MPTRIDLPLPRGWPARVKSGLLHAVALTRVTILDVHAQFENGRFARARRVAQADRLLAELAQVREELRLVKQRLARVPAHQRPHYEPGERLAVLTLRAGAGWSVAETARRFLISAATVSAWMRRLDEGGPDALVDTHTPVNRFPEFVAVLIATLRATFPTMGKRRVAQTLARLGLQLAPTTIARMLKHPRRPKPPDVQRAPPTGANTSPLEGRRVTAKYPHHLWHIDLTVLPIQGGFWAPWIPLSLAIVWPFAWTIAVVLDHHSRAVVAVAVFRGAPTTRQVCELLDRASANAGRRPRHLVSDQGCQFGSEYLAWCRRRGIRPRFGAVGEHGSIAVIERFIRSMKEEHLRRITLPFRQCDMLREVETYARWYNTERSHTALDGATPANILRGAVRAAPPIETRARYPLGRGKRRRRRLRGNIVIDLDRFEGRSHLPVVRLREAA